MKFLTGALLLIAFIPLGLIHLCVHGRQLCDSSTYPDEIGY